MALREILAKFGFEVDDKKLKDGKKGFDGFATSVKNLTEKILGGDVGDWIKETISDLKDQAATFRATSNQLGINAQELQRWQFAAKLAGVEAAHMNAALRFLQKNAAGAAHDSANTAQAFVDSGDGALEAALSGKQAAEQFKALGIEVKDSSGQLKGTTDLMREVGLAIGQIQNPAERTAISMKVFGRQGTALIPLFNKGEKGLQEFLGAIDDLGGGLSDETLKALSDNGKASKKWDMAILSLKSGIVGQLLPAMTAKVNLLTKIVAWFNRTIKGTNALRAAVLVVSAAFLILKREAVAAAIKTALAWAPTVLAVGALILILDDLMTALKGGDSVIGRFLKKAGDPGQNNSMFGRLREDLQALSKEMDKAPDVMGKIETVVDTVAMSIGRFIVEDIPDAFGFLWQDIKDGISEFLFGSEKTFSGWWTGFKGRVTDAFKGLSDSVTGFGSDMMTALANTIKSGIQKVVNAVDDLGSAFIKKLRDLFDWHSPPGLAVDFADDFTSTTAKGLIKGSEAIRKAAHVTFDAIMPGGPSAVAPTVKVASPASPTSRSLSVTNHVTNTIHAGQGGGGIQDAVRQGVRSGLSDLNHELAALEAQSA